MVRLGVYGGTFDPVHVAHIVAAVESRAVLGLDEVLLVVAGDPWQKRGRVVASAADRLAMVEAAVDGIDGLRVSDLEVRREGPAYTADTLEELAEPDRELFLILGADVVPLLSTWQRWERVAELATLAVLDRAGTGEIAVSEPWRAVPVPMPRLDISSSDLRGRVAGGQPIAGFVPQAVLRLIAERGLYTAGQ